MGSGKNGSLQYSSGADDEPDSSLNNQGNLFQTGSFPPFIPESSIPRGQRHSTFPSLTQLNQSGGHTFWPAPPGENLRRPFFEAGAVHQGSDVSSDPEGNKNPRKRTRASRRAPTTVLTTDTSNFRAMVQEFTGIPSPPFATPFCNTRPRVDLFGLSTGSRSDSLVYNPLQSTPQKLRPFHNPNTIMNSSSLVNYQTGSFSDLVSMIRVQNQPVSGQPSVTPLGVQHAKSSSIDDMGLLWKVGFDQMPPYESLIDGSMKSFELNHNLSHNSDDRLDNFAVHGTGQGTSQSWICHRD